MVGRQRCAESVIWGELAVADDDGEGGGMSLRVVVGKKREMVGQFRVCAITSQQCCLLIGQKPVLSTCPPSYSGRRTAILSQKHIACSMCMKQIGKQHGDCLATVI